MLMTVTALGLGVLAHQPFSEDCNDVNGELSQFFWPGILTGMLPCSTWPACQPAAQPEPRMPGTGASVS